MDDDITQLVPDEQTLAAPEAVAVDVVVRAEVMTGDVALVIPDDADDAPLGLVDRLIASLGGWAGTLAERWMLSSGPFFAADGRPTPLALGEPLTCGCAAPSP